MDGNQHAALSDRRKLGFSVIPYYTILHHKINIFPNPLTALSPIVRQFFGTF
jgi:hypothetical protein